MFPPFIKETNDISSQEKLSTYNAEQGKPSIDNKSIFLIIFLKTGS